MQVKCPECDGDIPVPEDVIPGEIVPCPDCGSEFEVYLNDEGGIELKPVEIEGEDWGE
jgi:alpha-aminoadipate carrier protein LysW